MIRLESIYDGDDAVTSRKYKIVYEALQEREPFESISHKGMPSWKEHIDFVSRIPYKGWYIIWHDAISVGSIYITYSNEIGIHIFKRHRRLGLGRQAIELLMRLHPAKEYFANINPDNTKSIKLFEYYLGFTHIQNTYRLEKK